MVPPPVLLLLLLLPPLLLNAGRVHLPLPLLPLVIGIPAFPAAAAADDAGVDAKYRDACTSCCRSCRLGLGAKYTPHHKVLSPRQHTPAPRTGQPRQKGP